MKQKMRFLNLECIAQKKLYYQHNYYFKNRIKIIQLFINMNRKIKDITLF